MVSERSHLAIDQLHLLHLEFRAQEQHSTTRLDRDINFFAGYWKCCKAAILFTHSFVFLTEREGRTCPTCSS